MPLISRKLLVRKPQQLGRIKIGRLGAKKKSERGKEFQMPVKLDHFIVTTNVRGADGNFEIDRKIHQKVGPKPTELRGILLFETPEENLHSEMVQYKGRGKKGKVWTCDGERATDLAKGESGDCLKAAGKECACKPYARFHIQLWDSPHQLGYHFYRTTSWESTNNLQSALEEIYERFGTCYGAPVVLKVYPSEDVHEDGVSTSHKVGLVLAESLRETAERIAESRSYLQIASGSVKALSAGVREELVETDAAEEADIAQEFFPPEEAEVHKAIVSDALHAPDDEEPGYEVVEDPPKPEPEQQQAGLEL